MNNFGFDTLIASNKKTYKNKWNPLIISNIEFQFKKSNIKDIPEGIRKNISYNLQYLEYLTFQFNELNLNSAIIMSLIKNYVVIGSSIIEAIFFWIIKSNHLCTKNNLEIICTTKSNATKYNNQEIVTETNIYRKVEPYEVEMTFDSMIKKIENKKILNIKHEAYPYIKKYRQLRNRIHLQLSENNLDTDWWSFKYNDYLLIRRILYIILSDDNIKVIDKNDNYFYFLDFNEKEKQDLIKYFSEKNKE